MKGAADVLIHACQADPAYRHLLTTFGERPMPCMDCGEEATRLGTLTAHCQLCSAWPSAAMHMGWPRWPSNTRGCR